MRRRLIEARKKAKLSQTQIALKAGIARSTYTHIERGSRSPSLEAAWRIARVLGESIESLFFSEEVAEKKEAASQ